jgi:hypothetical protein
MSHSLTALIGQAALPGHTAYQSCLFVRGLYAASAETLHLAGEAVDRLVPRGRLVLFANWSDPTTVYYSRRRVHALWWPDRVSHQTTDQPSYVKHLTSCDVNDFLHNVIASRSAGKDESGRAIVRAAQLLRLTAWSLQSSLQGFSPPGWTDVKGQRALRQGPASAHGEDADSCYPKHPTA